MKYLVFALGLIAIVLGLFSYPAVAVIGVVLNIGVAIFQFSEDHKTEARITERPFSFSPDDWSVDRQEGIVMSAKLIIPPCLHGYGEHVSVRLEQTEIKKWDLAEPKIESGRITITYAQNNFPGRGIALIAYISARG